MFLRHFHNAIAPRLVKRQKNRPLHMQKETKIMAVSMMDVLSGKLNVLVGKYYHFSTQEAVITSGFYGLVIDIDKIVGEVKLITDGDEKRNIPIQPLIFVEEIEKENSPEIEKQIDDIRVHFREIAQNSAVVYSNENEAVDGIEEKREYEAAAYYLRNGFPNKLFNTIPYVLNRSNDNSVAFELLVYALDYCASTPHIYPSAYIPYFPDQHTLFSKENIEVLRRVARIVRSSMVGMNYQEGNDIRFTGVITTFTGDHGWISVNDKMSLRFNKFSILDNRLIEILKLGMPAIGWVEVSFAVCRAQSGHYACRIRPTKLAIAVVRQLGYEITETGTIPDCFEDSPICGRNSLPQALQEALTYFESDKLFEPRETLCGEVIACVEDTSERSKMTGQILANGNIYHFHYFQVCDEAIAAAWREKRLIGAKVVFEPAFNFTKNVVILSADYVRYPSFCLTIPKADYKDPTWGVWIYDTDEMNSFIKNDCVSKEYVPLQPWLPVYDDFLPNCSVGKINPHATRQKGWIHLANGFRYGFSYSQIQDQLLYLLLNSSLREKIDWSKIDICFVPKKVNGTGFADNVILTMKSRIELSKKFGLEGPVMPLSEKMVFARRLSFVPFDADIPKYSYIDSSERITAEITDYNLSQERISLTQKTPANTDIFDLHLAWIKDTLLINVLTNNLWSGVYVTYQKKISSDGKYYPFDLKLTDLSKKKLEEDKSLNISETIIADVVQEPQYAPVIQPQIKREIGILLPTKREATLGYISKEYYTKACRTRDLPSGVACYEKQMLPFEPEYQYVYVVSYTYNTRQTRIIKNALSIEYLDKYEYSSLGKLIVNNDGSVKAISLIAVAADQYIHRNVDILLHSGDAISGVVDSKSEDGFSINTEEKKNVFVSFDSIEKAYIYGEIRPYFAVNGTGRIDQYFFFHINNLTFSAEAAQITDGTQVRFALRGIKRDNGVEAADIQVVYDDVLEVCVVGRRNANEYCIVNLSDYGVRFDVEEHIIHIKKVPDVLNFEFYDYKVRLRKRANETIWSWTSEGTSSPKLRYGYLIMIENQTAIIKDEEQYRTNREGLECACSEILYYRDTNDTNTIVDTSKYDYAIMYTLTKQLNGSISIHVMKVSEQKPKRRFGILHWYSPIRSFGFIVADEDADIPSETRRQQNIDYHCVFTSMQNPPASISTRHNRYYVAFIGETTFSGRRKATKVEFIAINPIAQTNRQSLHDNVGLRNSSSAEEEYNLETSTIDLKETSVTDSTSDKLMYGILRAYSPKFIEVRIFDNYVPAKFLEEGQAKGPIAIAHDELTIIADEVKTNKYVYLIRFAVTEDITEQREMPYTVDASVPIEVVQAFSRSATTSLQISDGILKIEKRILRNKFRSEINTIQADGNELLDYQKGETLFIESSSGEGSYIAEYIQTTSDGSIVSTRGLSNIKTQRIYRFGIITDFDENFSWGIINYCCRVDLSIMENKAYNMLRTLKKQMVIMYVCELGKIVSINRCDSRVMNMVTWNVGVVRRFVEDQDQKTRYLDIDVEGKTTTHYLSTMSDGYVSKRIKQNNLEEEHVYVKLVSLPVKKNDKISMVCVALDVHCFAEEDALIEYDKVGNRFWAARNPTYKVELYGSESLLRDYVGQMVEIVFEPNEQQLIAHIAAIGFDDDDDESVELLIDALPQTVFETSLARMLERRIDIGTYNEQLSAVLFRKVRRSGLKQSEQNWLLALLTKKIHGVSETFRYEGGRWRKSSSYMLQGIDTRLTEIFEDNDQLLDEYFYYANTLAQVGRIESKYALNLYRAFQTDYCSLGEIRNFERSMNSDQAFRERNFQPRLIQLFAKRNPKDSLVPHLAQLDDLRREYLAHQILSSCPQLARELGLWCQINGIISETQDVDALLRTIKERYRKAKGLFLNRLLSVDWISAIQRGEIDTFMKFITESDRARFSKFIEICKVVSDSINRAIREEFSVSESSLKEAYSEAKALKDSIEKHPTLEAVELLYNTGRIDDLLETIQSRINLLYTDERSTPRISVVLNNGRNIDYNTMLLLVIRNDAGSLQTANDVTISLVKYTDDDRINITYTPFIQGTSRTTCTLSPGETVVYEAKIVIDEDFPKEEKIVIGWSINYSRDGSFEDGKTNTVPETVDGEFNLQLRQDEGRIDKTKAINVYENKDKVVLQDSKMFFGREDEKGEIRDFILENDCFVSGRIVIVYGQKKCGKTSLICQIRNELLARGQGQQKALWIYIAEFYGEVRSIDPEKFYPQLYTMILQYIENAALSDAELADLLMDEDLLVPDMPTISESDRPAVFRRYILKLIKAIKEKYQIVLVMDEFTGWCAEIEKASKSKPEVLNSLLFVKLLSEFGFIQIIIGHANMEHALTSLGAYNKIGQFAKKINLSALKESDAKEMIIAPMIEQFGFNAENPKGPYSSPLGEMALDRILDLSGRSAFVLMRLCDSIFRWYKESPESQIIDSDILEIINEELAGNVKWPLAEFNFLLEESGDYQTSDEQRSSFKYLKEVALHYDSLEKGCDANICSREIGYDENGIVRSGAAGTLRDIEKANEEVRDKLVARHVISHEKNRVKIYVGLFREYIIRRYGNGR